MIPQANHMRFLDSPCRLLTIRTRTKDFQYDTRKEEESDLLRGRDAMHNGAQVSWTGV